MLKIVFNKATLSVGWTLLVAASAAAQLRAGDAAIETLAYRNGASWIAVERAHKGTSALHPMTLHAGARTFSAQVGPNAVVQLDAGAEAEALWQREGLVPIEALSPALHIYLVRGRGDEDGVDIAHRLANRPGIAEAIPDLVLRHVKHSISIPPDDPQYTGQWYLKKISIERAWQHSTGDRDTTIAVIDDGCDLKHPDLQANMLDGIDAINDTDDPSYVPRVKGNAHGTSCAGLIAAVADNQIGIAGVCPECTLRCVRLIRNDDMGIPVSAEMRAFNYALDHDVAVASNSWGYADPVPVPAPLRTLLEHLFDQGRGGRGTLLVFAAGNENREIGSDELQAVRGVLNIAASSNFDEATQFSNYGASLDLTAPAGTVTTDISGPDGDSSGDYTQLFGGTSSACPVAAGAAALVMSAKPELTAQEVTDLLIATARPAPYAEPDDRGHDKTYGYGIVDPAAALRKTLGITEPEPSDAGTSDDAGAAAPHKPEHSSSSCTVSRVRYGASHWLTWLGLACTCWIARRRRS